MRQSQLERFNKYQAVVCLIVEVRDQNNEAQSSRSKTSKRWNSAVIGWIKPSGCAPRSHSACWEHEDVVGFSVLVAVVEPPEEQVDSSLLPVEAVPKTLVIIITTIIIIIIRITVQWTWQITVVMWSQCCPMQATGMLEGTWFSNRREHQTPRLLIPNSRRLHCFAFGIDGCSTFPKGNTVSNHHKHLGLEDSVVDGFEPSASSTPTNPVSLLQSWWSLVGHFQFLHCSHHVSNRLVGSRVEHRGGWVMSMQGRWGSRFGSCVNASRRPKTKSRTFTWVHWLIGRMCPSK